MSSGCRKCQHGEPCYANGHKVWVFSQTGEGYYFTAEILSHRKYQVNDGEFWCYSFPLNLNSRGVFWQSCDAIDPFLDHLSDMEKL